MTDDQCHVCKRTQKDIDEIFSDILVPFRKNVTDIDERKAEIIKESTKQFKKFQKKHKGKDYLDLSFQTVWTDKEGFTKMIENLDDFFTYAHWKNAKLEMKDKLSDIIDYVMDDKFFEIDFKNKYINEDPRIEMKDILEERKGWRRLIKRYEISKYDLTMFKSQDFMFLPKARRLEMEDYLMDKRYHAVICPVCKDMIS